MKILSATPPVADYAFNNYDIPLYVPDESVEAYKTQSPWSNFTTIVGLSKVKCAKPTITVLDGKLIYSCETEGVKYKWSYSCSNNVENEGNETILTGTITAHVSVIATKKGLDNSEVAIADVELQVGKKGDVNQDGVVSISDAVSVVNIILNNGGADAPAMDEPQEQEPEAVPE